MAKKAAKKEVKQELKEVLIESVEKDVPVIQNIQSKTEYVIIRTTGEDNFCNNLYKAFEEIVNAKIEAGYELYGSPFSSVYRGESYLNQAMIKNS